MAKMRGFKPDLWSDDDFVEASPLARLLWLGMWNHACDNGHLPDKPRQIKRKVLPADDESGEALVSELADLGLVVRADGWITIPNLRKHQRIDPRYFLVCDFPDCEKPATPKRETRSANTVSTAGARRGHALPHDEGEGEGEGEGEERKRADKSAARSKKLPDDFAPNDTNRRLAAERGLDLDSVVEQFKDFHIAKGSKFVDWHRALNTWLRREKPNPVAAQAASATPRLVARQCDNPEPHPGHRWEWYRNHFNCQGVQP